MHGQHQTETGHRCWHDDRPTSVSICRTDVGDVGTTNIGGLLRRAALSSAGLYSAKTCLLALAKFEYENTRAGKRGPMLVRPTPPTSLRPMLARFRPPVYEVVR